MRTENTALTTSRSQGWQHLSLSLCFSVSFSDCVFTFEYYILYNFGQLRFRK